jgi:hypothetical protein
LCFIGISCFSHKRHDGAVEIASLFHAMATLRFLELNIWDRLLVDLQDIRAKAAA